MPAQSSQQPSISANPVRSLPAATPRDCLSITLEQLIVGRHLQEGLEFNGFAERSQDDGSWMHALEGTIEDTTAEAQA